MHHKHSHEALYDVKNGCGLTTMINGDMNNSLQSVVQILLEVEGLAANFASPHSESDFELYTSLKKLFVLGYKTLPDGMKRKPLNLKPLKTSLMSKFDLGCHRYSAIDILKCILKELHQDFVTTNTAKASIGIKKLGKVDKGPI